LTGATNAFFGATDQEIREYAKSIYPREVEFRHDPTQGYGLLILKREPEVEMQAGISRTVTAGSPSAGAQLAARKRTLEQVKGAVESYKADRLDSIISELKMEDILKERYADKNTIYKIPRKITRETTNQKRMSRRPLHPKLLPRPGRSPARQRPDDVAPEGAQRPHHVALAVPHATPSCR
jgi:hypothetical protein